VHSNRFRAKLSSLAICAVIATASLLHFGTGSHPHWLLTWFAALPVFLIIDRIGPLPTFGVAAFSWFVGELNMWQHFRYSLGFSLSSVVFLFGIPSFVFGLVALVYRRFIRRGALWQAALAVPFLWVSYEYLMAALPRYRALPSIGYTQMDWLPVFHVTSLAGIWGISFSLFLLPSSIAVMLSERGNKAQTLKVLASVLFGFLAVAVLHRLWIRHADILPENQDTIDDRQIFDRSVVMIPMRDGVHLYTEIYTPKGLTEPLPFVIERGNGDLGGDAAHYTPNLAKYSAMFPDKYIFVFQEIRGRYSSEGQFIMLRPPRDPADPNATDEATDAYDTIDWLVRNVPNNNGRVGLNGISYGGWLATMALLDPHPALKAISELASPADMFLGDDFHHNGAFRLSYGFEYVSGLESSRKSFGFPFDRNDMFDWYLALGPLSNVNAFYFHNKLPTWNNFVAHPNYDEFWKKQGLHRYLLNLKLTVPLLNVAGWWDEEDFYGPVRIYEDLEIHDTDHKNYLVIGPWSHGGMAYSRGTKLSVVDFGSDTSAYFRQKLQAPWFAFWLHEHGALPSSKTMIFETGSNRWKSYEAWPPEAGTTRRQLYFHANGELSFDPPLETEKSFDSYLSDPDNPVPYRHRPVEVTYSSGSHWHTWLLEDQRFVQTRPDVVTWSTEPLTEDLTVSGDITAQIFASTTGTDSDWIVKLIDAYPDEYPQDPKLSGYELMISNEVFRGRFYESFDDPKPLVPNRVTPFIIDLHTNDHTFLKGHRIMVQVQSTWFPLIDRNPQKYTPSIFSTHETEYQKATQHIYRSHEYPSSIEIPVATR
jgi:uncharacterized protein